MYPIFNRLPRRAKRLIMVAADMVMLPLALWAAIALRLGTFAPDVSRAWWLFVLVPLASVPAFAALGLYRAVVRYMGPQAVFAVLKGVSLSTLILTALVLLQGLPQVVPRSSIVLYWLIALMAIGGSRFLVRAYLQMRVRRGADAQPVVIYGAGHAGVTLAHSLMQGEEYQPVAFVDDDRSLRKSLISGIRVYPPRELSRLIEEYDVSLVLLAIPSMSRSRRRQIFTWLESLHVSVKTLPTMDELISGEGKLDQVRDVQIEDLLGRDPVAPNQALLDACIAGKSVMVTGAGGSIGSELCRQIVRLAPRRLVLVESAEYNLYRIERELRAIMDAEHCDFDLVPLLGSVTDQAQMLRAMQSLGVQTVYHAAAYKHVPIVEYNSLQGVYNNVFGTYQTAKAALQAEVETFVLISTDKAVRPTNVMGATKRFAEIVLQGLAQQQSATRFCMVRFGNVLGSSGSVVPLFREQIRPGGVVTVTHPDITRYFMTIPEAAALVIQAGSMGEGGDVFVLDMGEPVKILDLARRMIRLMGYDVKDDDNPEGDVEIRFTGLRPGEKLYEELLIGDNVTGTPHPMIMRAQEECLPPERVHELLTMLEAACHSFDCQLARRALREAVSGYVCKNEIEDILWRVNTAQAAEADSNVIRLH